ncbi:MAG: DUF5723 family protein [Bacteroidota bacterium]|nr:DUF5723 family protein [Bacteroidota bacterium]
MRFRSEVIKKIFPLIMILIMPGISSSAQEMYGTALGNYSGVNGIQLNPSSMNNSKTYIDVNFLSGDLFLQQNYLYLKNSEFSLSDIFRKGYTFPAHTEYGTSGLTFYHYANQNNRQAYENIRLNGPGVMVAFGPHTLALTTSVRSVFSVTDIPYEIANFTYIGLKYKPQQNIFYNDKNYAGMAELTWLDIGLSYSTVLYGRNFDVLAGGISIRRLEGYSGAYMYMNKADYKVPDDTTVIIRNMDANYGYSLPLDYNAQKYWGSDMIKGSGFAFDLGFTYYRLNRLHQKQYFNHICEPQAEDYEYRIGVALIDAGAISFYKHAAQYSIDNRSSQWDGLNHFQYSTIQQLMDTISYRFYGSKTAAYRGNSMTIWLPSALSIQFDYHLQKKWYLNASLIYGFRFAPNSLTRPTQLAVTPRYETENFEVDVPFSMYNKSMPRIGLAIRAYGITIGTDKLGWLFNFNDMTGMDIYFALKFSLNKGRCKTRATKNCQDYNMIHHSRR